MPLPLCLLRTVCVLGSRYPRPIISSPFFRWCSPSFRPAIAQQGVRYNSSTTAGYASTRVNDWTADLLWVREQAERWHAESTGRPVRFNVCLLNRYDGGDQSLGWHADREEMVRPARPLCHQHRDSSSNRRRRPSAALPCQLAAAYCMVFGGSQGSATQQQRQLLSDVTAMRNIVACTTCISTCCTGSRLVLGRGELDLQHRGVVLRLHLF